MFTSRRPTLSTAKPTSASLTFSLPQRSCVTASMSPPQTARVSSTAHAGNPSDAICSTRALPSRQTLSCTPCRKRKVKCDRTTPCSACCARGRPGDCQFIVVDGSDYSIVQQSYEIRELRKENKRLKEQFRSAAERHHHHVNPDGDVRPGRARICRNVALKRRRTAVGYTCDNPSQEVSTLAELFGPQIATVSSVKGGSTAASQCAAYPFPSLRIGDNTTEALTRLLPSKDEIVQSIGVFHGILQTLAIPQIPDRTRPTEIEDFLSDIGHNATREPAMLALLFAVLALVSQETMNVKDCYAAASKEDSVTRRKCYIAASMQALRDASFMNEPNLLGIKTLLIIGLCLIKSGQLEDVWTMFGMITRLAQSIGLHRDPDTVSPTLSPYERTVRRHIWWAMLHMDQHLSNMLCRPLGIPNAGNCDPPKSFASNPLELRLSAIVIESTILTREILSFDGSITPDRVATYTGKLLDLWSTMPEALRLKESWFEANFSLPEWPLDIMSAKVFADIQFLIVILKSYHSPRNSGLGFGFLHTTATSSATRDCLASPCHTPELAQNYRLINNGCVHILRVFLFLWGRRSSVLVCHLADLQAVNAAMILVRDALETGVNVNLPLLDKTYQVFVEMKQSGGSQLSNSAVERLSVGLRCIQA